MTDLAVSAPEDAARASEPTPFPRRTLTAEQLREFATGKLARHKIPRYVHVVDEFPMTVTGKVRKVDMRETAIGILGIA